MRWLIDGYNVIRRDPDLRAVEARGLQAGRAALLRLVAEAAGRATDLFTVVFDGAPIPGVAAPPGRLQVIFSRPPQRADDVLVRMARQYGNGAVVVTSDRAVQDAARRAGCAVLGAAEFLAGLANGDETDEGSGDAAPDRAAPKRGNPRRSSKRARA
ncbi:MAG: NYN domain-containing protein, partial [Candidatus Rokuibacteriota bacterium]